MKRKEECEPSDALSDARRLRPRLLPDGKHMCDPCLFSSATQLSPPLFKNAMSTLDDSKYTNSEELLRPALQSIALRPATRPATPTQPSSPTDSLPVPQSLNFVLPSQSSPCAPAPQAAAAGHALVAPHCVAGEHALENPTMALDSWRPCACRPHSPVADRLPLCPLNFTSVGSAPHLSCGRVTNFRQLIQQQQQQRWLAPGHSAPANQGGDEEGTASTRICPPPITASICVTCASQAETSACTQHLLEASGLPKSSSESAATLLNSAVHAVPYSHPPSEVPLFHLAALDDGDPLAQEIARETQGVGFERVALLQVQQPLLRSQFNYSRSAVAAEAGADNVKVLYHATAGNLFCVCQFGLSRRFSRGGFFGRGIYLSDSPLKAHGYARNRDDPHAIKALLRCRVALGRVKQFDRLHFDRDLTSSPPGYHAVSGFISTGREYTVFNDENVLVTEILLYRCRLPGPNVQHVAVPVGDQLVLISRAVLSFAIRQLSLIAVHTPQHIDHARRLLLALVTRRLPLDEFVRKFAPIAGGPPPQSLRDMLTTELSLPSS
jgi:hypothetical protein